MDKLSAQFDIMITNDRNESESTCHTTVENSDGSLSDCEAGDTGYEQTDLTGNHFATWTHG